MYKEINQRDLKLATFLTDIDLAMLQGARFVKKVSDANGVKYYWKHYGLLYYTTN